MSDNGYIPLTPDTFSEGGGLLDDVDATIESARFVEFDFLGKADKPALCLQVAYKVDGDSAKARVEYYSAGALTRFKPSPDGKNLVKVGQATSLKRDSNAGIFLGRAVEADPELSKGLSNPKVGVSCFDGRRVHLVRIPQPDRGGRVGKQGGTLLIITKFLAGAGKGKAADLDFDLDDATTGAIVETLTEHGAVTKAKLTQLLFKALDGNPHRKDITQRALDPEFLKASDVFAFDGKTLSLPE